MDPKLTSNFCQYPNAAGGVQSDSCNEYDSTGAVVMVHPFGAAAGQELPTTPKFKGNLTTLRLRIVRLGGACSGLSSLPVFGLAGLADR
jgi:hypothetical protein